MTVWKRRARNVATGIVLLLVAAGAAVSWLWQDRQGIDDFGWPPAPTLDNGAAVVTATWKPRSCSTALSHDQAS